MGLFRRREETYNERMLREAGLLDEQREEPANQGERTPEFDAFPSPSPTDLHGTRAGPREWDAMVTATAPGLAGDEIRFTALPGGDLIVEEEQGEANLSALADAVESRIEPPYNAVAARQNGDLWAVGAKRIVVARIEAAEGDTLELSSKDSWQELRVDGQPSDGRIPYELEQLGERAGADFFVRAERIDGDFWEVRVSAL
jgi:hypothetical protein